MREKVRERSSHSLRQERRSDFREKLSSIFVDNLHPKADQLCLWGLFKTFGQVRDVYLSAANDSRRSGFAFVRFASLEEARRVADETNGMYIYGWPISSKVALYGWNNRRLATSRAVGQGNEEGGLRGGQHRGVAGLRGQNRGNLSFAEAVKGNQRKAEEWEEQRKDGSVSLVLDRMVADVKWLDKCAIGVLKDFSSVRKVNKRLMERGFCFSSAYLGGKSILWSFESEYESEGFIKSRFFWEDTFVTMEKWSKSTASQARPAWVYIAGIPLNHWNKAFFKMLGNMLGDLLLIEDETVFKRRLDRGKLLVAMPGDRPCPSSVKVVEKFGSFHVSIEKDVLPIDSGWLEEKLGLNFEFTERRAAFPDLAKFSNVSGFLPKIVPKVGEKERGADSWKAKAMDKMDKRSIGRKDDKVGIEYLSKPKSDSALNGKLILKKSNTVRNIGEIGDNRSSFSDLDGSSDSNLKSLEREPKSFEDEGDDGSDRPCRGDGLLKDFVSVPSRFQTQAPDSPMHSSVGQVYGALSGTSKGPRQSNLDLHKLNTSGISTDALPHDTDLVSDPDEGDVGEVGNDRSMKRVGRKRIQPVKSHGMKTRLSKARALDLNHDIVKEDIVPMVKKASWNLRDEIAKVIKARKVLGFDVVGKEKDIVEEIIRRIKTGTFGKKGLYCANN